jgi:hypothetical protein
MAASVTAAIEDLEARAGERFDRAVGYLVTPPRARPTPSHIRAAFEPVRQEDIDRLVHWLIGRYGGPEADAREATQDTFAKLLRRRPEVFRSKREDWWRVVRREARFRLLEIKEGQRETVPVDSQIEPESTAIDTESSALPVSPAACDYTWVEPPLAGEDWVPIQILGALQRYARHYRKPPREVDCGPLHRLPRPAAIRVRFGSFGAAMVAAGMPGRSRGRVSELRAAQQCYSFRRRHNRWPDTSDFRRGSGQLPSPRVAKRIFGSSRSGVVGEVAEAILQDESASS